MGLANRSLAMAMCRRWKSKIPTRRTRRWRWRSTTQPTRTCTTLRPIWPPLNKKRGKRPMKIPIFVTSLLLCTLPLSSGLLYAQGGVDPADAAKPLSDQWITYSGDYSGKRFSLLKQVNASTVKHLSLGWLQTGIVTGCGATGAAPAGGFGAGGGAPAPIIIGGLGTGDANN